MIEIAFLGTAGASSSRERDNTFLGLMVNGAAYLVDCAGSPVQKAERAGFPWMSVSAVFITHLHADHFYGLPSLIHQLKIGGRTDKLTVFCGEAEVGRLVALLDVFRFTAERGYAIEVCPVVDRSPPPLVDEENHVIVSVAGKHAVPSYGIRIDDLLASRRVVYSSDTWRSEAIVAAAMDADLLIHEASFFDDELSTARSLGHCTAGEAGRIGKACRAKQLALVHLSAENGARVDLLREEAEQEYGGSVIIPADLSWIRL